MIDPIDFTLIFVVEQDVSWAICLFYGNRRDMLEINNLINEVRKEKEKIWSKENSKHFRVAK